MNEAAIITTYTDAIKMMKYNDDFCGCCKLREFNDWYEDNNSYFIKKGYFLVDELMRYDPPKGDDLIEMRYCLHFDFEDKEVAHFKMYNYYNQKVFCEFDYIRSENDDVNNPKIKLGFVDYKEFEETGAFYNDFIISNLNKEDDFFYRKNGSLPKKKFMEAYDKHFRKRQTMTVEFMANHSMHMILSAMFYFTLEKPKDINYESIEKEKEKEILTKKGIIKYKYTGYIQLDKERIYRAKINDNLDKKKRANYERHIGSWQVRGHWRNLSNGKKIWIEPHIKGEGELEKRVYGIGEVDASDVIVPKVFERVCDVVVKDEKASENVKTEIIEESTCSIEDIVVVNRLTWWQRIKLFIKKIFNININEKK